MLKLSHHGGRAARHGRSAIAFWVFAKLALVAALLVLLGLGVSATGLGTSVVVAHVVILAAVGTVLAGAYLIGGRARHGALLDTSSHRAGDHAKGIVLHDAAHYDLLVSLLTLGGEGRLRERMLRPAGLRPGEAVLDVACGTGTLALAAKRQVGSAGSVIGLDASAEMVERARTKAEKVGLDLPFVQGAAQDLPFGDGQFDIVLGTLMLHHLPKSARTAFFREARRVLRPGGRLLVVDFGRPAQAARRSKLRLHRHGHVDLEAVVQVLVTEGFEIAGRGEVGAKSLHYVLARPTRTSGPTELSPDLTQARLSGSVASSKI